MSAAIQSPRQVYQALRPLIDELYTKIAGSTKGSTGFEYSFVSVFDTLPDFATHTYSITVTQAASPLAIATGEAIIVLAELT